MKPGEPTVLIVDDDEEIRHVLRLVCEADDLVVVGEWMPVTVFRNAGGGRLERLQVRDGTVGVEGGGGSVTWGELIDGQTIDLAVEDDAPLKPAAEHRLVGRSLQRPDIPAKVTGTFMYAQNVRLPGMVHARMVMPPGIGSELVSVDESSVADIPGLVAVVRRNNLLAVVAETEWEAIRASRRLRAEWTDWQGLPEQDRLYEDVRATPVAQTDVDGERGDIDAALQQADHRFEATYDFAIQMHGSIGPSCAVAQIDNGRVTVWSPSQAPQWTREEVARALGVTDEDVRFIYVEGAACFGRNGHEDCSVQAALIAREVGRPVRLQWMREDEHGWEPKGPPTLVDLEAGTDSGGRITAWRAQYYIPKQTGLLPIDNLGIVHAGVGHEPVLNPGRIQNQAVAGYAFPNHQAILHRLETTPFRPSWIRSPGRMQNTYAIEAFMDELAAAAGAGGSRPSMVFLRVPSTSGISISMIWFVTQCWSRSSITSRIWAARSPTSCPSSRGCASCCACWPSTRGAPSTGRQFSKHSGRRPIRRRACGTSRWPSRHSGTSCARRTGRRSWCGRTTRTSSPSPPRPTWTSSPSREPSPQATERGHAVTAPALWPSTTVR